MPRLLRLVFSFALASLVALSVAPARAGDAPDESHAKASWTFLVYHDADCDLEAPMLNDIEEMMAADLAGNLGRVRIVALIDRSPAGEPEGRFSNRDVGGLKDWADAKFVEVTKDALHVVGEQPGEVNMGDPATLTQFIERGMNEFPADHYALILGDHGASWPGVCADDSSGNDILTLPELQAALEKATAGHGPLDVVGFDACLMASVEVASVVAPFARVMVASEELEPGSGWWYTPFLEGLARSASADAATLGAAIADRFQESFSKQKGVADPETGRTITLSVIDLSKIKDVVAAEAALGEAATKVLAEHEHEREHWIALAKARSAAEEYGRSADPAQSMNCIDLGDLARRLESVPEAKPAAAHVVEAVDAAVVHRIHGDLRPDSHGLSIWFPREMGAAKARYAASSLPEAAPWLAFLERFGAIAAADSTLPTDSGAAATGATLEGAATITLTTTVASPDDLDRASLVLAKKQANATIVVGAIPADVGEDGKIHETWNGSWFTLEDGRQKVLLPISEFEEEDAAADTYLVEAPAQVRPKGAKEWQDVTLTFFLDEDEGTLRGEFITATAFEGDVPTDVPLEPGDEVRAVYLRVEADGSVHRVVTGDADILTVDAEQSLKVGYDRVPAGDWLVGFWLADLAGNSSLSTTPVAVK